MGSTRGTLRVGVTGATGFIGQELLGALRKKRYVEIVAIVRESSNVTGVERILDAPNSKSEIKVANLMSTSSVAEAIQDCDAVIHLAAVVDGFVSGYSEDAEATNAGMARAVAGAVIEEAQRRGERMRLIHVSSTEAMGETSACGTPADEDSACQPDSAYGRGKLEAEAEMRKAGAHSMVNVIVLRPTGVYGATEQFFFRELVDMCECGLAVVAPSPCTGRLMLTHVSDVVNSIMLALRTGAEHSEEVAVLNISPNASLTYKEILYVLNDALGRVGPIVALPSWAGRAAMRVLGPLIYASTGNRRFLYHPDSIRRTCEMRVYSNTRARNVLGFTPKHEMVQGITTVVQDGLARGLIPRRRISPLLRYAMSACVLLGGVLWRASAVHAENGAAA